MLSLLVLLGGCTLTVFFFWGIRQVAGHRLQLMQRLDAYSDTSAHQQLAQQQNQAFHLDWRQLLSTLGHQLAHVTPHKLLDHLQKILIAAGVPLRGDELVLISAGLGVLVGLVLFIFSLNIATSLLGVAIGAMVPYLVLQRVMAKRLKALEEQLGDSLLFLANALKAGNSFMQALQLAVSETRPPFCDELKQVLHEVNLGVPTDQALANMNKRLPSDDLDLVVTAVLIQRQIGGNLAEILENIASTIRERFRIRGEVRAMTAQGKMSGLIIGFLPVAIGLVLFVINPAYIMSLFAHPLGLTMLAAAAIGEVVGALIIKKIVSIEV